MIPEEIHRVILGGIISFSIMEKFIQDGLVDLISKHTQLFRWLKCSSFLVSWTDLIIHSFIVNDELLSH